MSSQRKKIEQITTNTNNKNTSTLYKSKKQQCQHRQIKKTGNYRILCKVWTVNQEFVTVLNDNRGTKFCMNDVSTMQNETAV